MKSLQSSHISEHRPFRMQIKQFHGIIFILIPKGLYKTSLCSLSFNTIPHFYLTISLLLLLSYMPSWSGWVVVATILFHVSLMQTVAVLEVINIFAIILIWQQNFNFVPFQCQSHPLSWPSSSPSMTFIHSLQKHFHICDLDVCFLFRIVNYK